MLTTGQDIEGKKVILRLFFLQSCVFRFSSSVGPKQEAHMKRTHTFLFFFLSGYWRRAGLGVFSFSPSFPFSIVFGLHSKFGSNLWLFFFFFLVFYLRSVVRSNANANSIESHSKHLAACGAITIECIKLHSLAIWACARASSAVDQSELEKETERDRACVLSAAATINSSMCCANRGMGWRVEPELIASPLYSLYSTQLSDHSQHTLAARCFVMERSNRLMWFDRNDSPFCFFLLLSFVVQLRRPQCNAKTQCGQNVSMSHPHQLLGKYENVHHGCCSGRSHEIQLNERNQRTYRN